MENLVDLNKTLKSLRIDPREELKPPQKAIGIVESNGEENIIGTLGNFSLVIGKAKAKKSFFIGIAVATAISEDLIFNKFKGHLPKGKSRVLYFDTEQGKYHVQLALKRVCKLAKIDEPENLEVYGLRSQSPADRLSLIEHAINKYDDVGLVIIDGIKDLVTSINDEEQATIISSKLLKWTEVKNIHIMVVLHQNKSDTNARGHIGTELVNKAETVISITIDKKNKEVSIVEAEQVRNKAFGSFAFSVNMDGLPQLDKYTVEANGTRMKEGNKLLNLTGLDRSRLLTRTFENDEFLTYSTLIIQVKLSYKNLFKKDVGDNKIKEFITDCKNKELISQDGKKKPYKLSSHQTNKTEFENFIKS